MTDKNGKSLKSDDDQLRRWPEHFEKLLNRPLPENPPDIPEAERDLPINCAIPTKAETRKAVLLLRNGN